MSKKVDEVLENVEQNEGAKTEMVPKEAYDNLYAQAVALEGRYRKLFELYNNLLEAYLNQK